MSISTRSMAVRIAASLPAIALLAVPSVSVSASENVSENHAVTVHLGTEESLSCDEALVQKARASFGKPLGKIEASAQGSDQARNKAVVALDRVSSRVLALAEKESNLSRTNLQCALSTLFAELNTVRSRLVGATDSSDTSTSSSGTQSASMTGTSASGSESPANSVGDMPVVGAIPPMSVGASVPMAGSSPSPVQPVLRAAVAKLQPKDGVYHFRNDYAVEFSLTDTSPNPPDTVFAPVKCRIFTNGSIQIENRFSPFTILHYTKDEQGRMRSLEQQNLGASVFTWKKNTAKYMLQVGHFFGADQIRVEFVCDGMQDVGTFILKR